jgi:hypothetical protein
MPTHPTRNFLIAYILLVGLPIVGLLAVLKSGHTLKAPISVDGVWHLQVDAASLATLPCGKTLADNPEAELAISQSGKNFTLTVANEPKSASSGIIEGTTVNATIAPSPDWSAQAGCGGDHGLTLLATVDANASPRTMSGHISASHCPSCSAIEFQAVRQNPPLRRGSH